MKTLSIDLTVTAEVPDDYDPHDLTAYMRWETRLIDGTVIDDLGVDVSVVKIKGVVERHMPDSEDHVQDALSFCNIANNSAIQSRNIETQAVVMAAQAQVEASLAIVAAIKETS